MQDPRLFSPLSKLFELQRFFCYTVRHPQGEDDMSVWKNFKNTASVIALGALMTACDKPGVDQKGEGNGPGTDPVQVTSYSITGKAGSVSFYKADSTVRFWQKVYGETAADDKLVEAKISASTKAKGEIVSFENNLITAENVKEFSNQIVYLKNYELNTGVSVEGKNIGKTSDGKYAIKDMRFSGTKTQILADGANNLNDVLNVVNNSNLKWRLVGDKATGYGGQDKVYSLVVN
ncbi:hypothetical protein DYBT9275_04939 [Dyadobacter sp. CECT 9275]|uniref:Uncharacterized protein n=1 Tax=Dyadobacter helix TaxID=2822344 RepID=A0A916JIU2_9BACT|nr:hypothetical protein [Dyadobacter sp. CECT 9275]CAG5011389.1 hypothetical protein DYBT9275_04939 [Dyadobacter sp. CECT 9275]